MPSPDLVKPAVPATGALIVADRPEPTATAAAPVRVRVLPAPAAMVSPVTLNVSAVAEMPLEARVTVLPAVPPKTAALPFVQVVPDQLAVAKSQLPLA